MMVRSAGLFIRLIMLVSILSLSGLALAQENIHVVQRGESLYRIAQRYGISINQLIEANNLANPDRIFAGQKLLIPNFDPSPAEVENPLIAGTPTYHTVSPGETLASIAARYGMTVQQIVEINNLANPNLVYRGQKLVVWATIDSNLSPDGSVDAQISVLEPLETAPPVATQITYMVQRGDNLAAIARRFGLSWTEIANANGLSNPDQIYSGQTLNIPDSAAVSDLGIVDPSTIQVPVNPAPATILSGRQVVVDLSDQMLYAYEDGQLVRSLMVSTGLPATPTVLGDYKVYRKYVAQTMSGPGYYLPAVPYVMYFYQGYALHGTYWHNNFGNPMSHGCVNMPTPEAEWFYNNFVDVGTPVHVQA